MAQSTVLPTFRFMALPAKLRDAVYEEAYICKERYIVVMRRGPDALCMTDLPISPGVSKPYRREALPYYYGCNKFDVDDMDVLRRFLSQPDVKTHIRDLTCTYDASAKSPWLADLLNGMVQLEALQVYIAGTQTVREPHKKTFIDPTNFWAAVPDLKNVRGLRDVKIEPEEGQWDESVVGKDRDKLVGQMKLQQGGSGSPDDEKSDA